MTESGLLPQPGRPRPVLSGNKLTIELPMTEAMKELLPDTSKMGAVSGTILGQPAKVTWTAGLVLVLTALVKPPPIDLVSCNVRVDCSVRCSIDNCYTSLSLGDIATVDLAKIKEVEFRFLIAPMCRDDNLKG